MLTLAISMPSLWRKTISTSLDREVEGLGTSEELVNKATYVEGHQFTFILSTLSI
jgi:hypothetical protein